MQSQLQASYENAGREINQDLFPGQMEQAASWPELLSPGELLNPGRHQALAGRESKLDISLKSPWLYLSLILLLWLLLL
jgi:hypothetical protein